MLALSCLGRSSGQAQFVLRAEECSRGRPKRASAAEAELGGGGPLGWRQPEIGEAALALGRVDRTQRRLARVGGGGVAPRGSREAEGGGIGEEVPGSAMSGAVRDRDGLARQLLGSGGTRWRFSGGAEGGGSSAWVRPN
ncbi:hypothetical protein E2562_035784 [Oryza meyeriana var. granulata]|uniref:DUF834 domain-containing protein n=1 Tax=Oryza meyeriana var. granulata TaxID=110450 RepID=A0A6G1CMM1_9ORYZ|nr:hypothetical protein E2562_035784 [Oryza meyeriana var. granulata]